jgi:hypothetical protein
MLLVLTTALKMHKTLSYIIIICVVYVKLFSFQNKIYGQKNKLRNGHQKKKG